MANEKRLIDANALLLEIEEELAHASFFFTHNQNEMIDCGLRIAANDIRRQPTVDAVEVVHGRWVGSGQWNHKPCRMKNKEKWQTYLCSECGHSNGRRFNDKYCPNCGAKMDGDGNDQ